MLHVCANVIWIVWFACDRDRCSSPATAADAAPCWFPPVTGTVTDPYREPPCPWCAGNRGLDYRVGGDVGGSRRGDRASRVRGRGRRRPLRRGPADERLAPYVRPDSSRRRSSVAMSFSSARRSVGRPDRSSSGSESETTTPTRPDSSVSCAAGPGSSRSTALPSDGRRRRARDRARRAMSNPTAFVPVRPSVSVAAGLR